MADFTLSPDADALVFDLAAGASGAVLAEDAGLRTAVIASLFTWRRANADDVLPDPAATDRKGYWGDSFAQINGRQVGSRLWLLARRVRTDGVAEEARQMCIEALDWLIEDGVAAAVDVIVTAAPPRRLNLGVRIHRHDGTVEDLDFGDVWQGIMELAA